MINLPPQQVSGFYVNNSADWTFRNMINPNIAMLGNAISDKKNNDMKHYAPNYYNKAVLPLEKNTVKTWDFVPLQNFRNMQNVDQKKAENARASQQKQLMGLIWELNQAVEEVDEAKQAYLIEKNSDLLRTLNNPKLTTLITKEQKDEKEILETLKQIVANTKISKEETEEETEKPEEATSISPIYSDLNKHSESSRNFRDLVSKLFEKKAEFQTPIKNSKDEIGLASDNDFKIEIPVKPEKLFVDKIEDVTDRESKLRKAFKIAEGFEEDHKRDALNSLYTNGKKIKLYDPLEATNILHQLQSPIAPNTILDTPRYIKREEPETNQWLVPYENIPPLEVINQLASPTPKKIVQRRVKGPIEKDASKLYKEYFDPKFTKKEQAKFRDEKRSFAVNLAKQLGINYETKNKKIRAVPDLLKDIETEARIRGLGVKKLTAQNNLQQAKLKGLAKLTGSTNYQNVEKRLKIIIGELEAGSDSKALKNELSQILNILLSNKLITNNEAKEATKKYILN